MAAVVIVLMAIPPLILISVSVPVTVVVSSVAIVTTAAVVMTIVPVIGPIIVLITAALVMIVAPGALLFGTLYSAFRVGVGRSASVSVAKWICAPVRIYRWPSSTPLLGRRHYLKWEGLAKCAGSKIELT